MHVPCKTWIYVRAAQDGRRIQETVSGLWYTTLDQCEPGDFYRAPSTTWYYMGHNRKWLEVRTNNLKWRNYVYDDTHQRWYRVASDPTQQPQTYGVW